MSIQDHNLQPFKINKRRKGILQEVLNKYRSQSANKTCEKSSSFCTRKIKNALDSLKDVTHSLNKNILTQGLDNLKLKSHQSLNESHFDDSSLEAPLLNKKINLPKN